jgi:hypothetical protein
MKKTIKQELPKWFKGETYQEGGNVTNKFSGDSFELNNLELSMYDFIMGSQMVMEIMPKSVTQAHINDFHKALTWFRRQNTDAYYVLLD